MLAKDAEEVPSFKEAKRAFETRYVDGPAAPLRRQHQPRGAPRQEGPQGLLRRDPPHRRRPGAVPLGGAAQPSGYPASDARRRRADDVHGRSAGTISPRARQLRGRGGRGAAPNWVALPENFAYLRREGNRLSLRPGARRRDRRQPARAGQARISIWLLGGSFPEAVPGDERVYNTSVLVSPQGEVEASTGRSTSSTWISATSGGGRLRGVRQHRAGRGRGRRQDALSAGSGLSICYDLRFPELYRALSAQDVRFLTVPERLRPRDRQGPLGGAAAGPGHREPVLRAGAGPVRTARPDRASYGRSMIIDPWGLVLAVAPDRPCVIAGGLRPRRSRTGFAPPSPLSSIAACEPMSRSVPVQIGGDVSAELEGPGAKAMLLIRNGGFEGMSYEITAEETLIGRNPTTDITLLDEGISREHALIVYDPDDDTYTIEDLQSTNGTKVNGKRVRSSQLADGDDLQIGHTHFRFLLAPPAKG